MIGQPHEPTGTRSDLSNIPLPAPIAPSPASIDLRPSRARRSALALFVAATFSMLAILSTPLGRFIPLLRTPVASKVALGRVEALVRPFMPLAGPGATIGARTPNPRIAGLGPSASGPAVPVGSSPGSRPPSGGGTGSGGSGGTPPPIKHGYRTEARRLRAKFDGHIHLHSFMWLRQHRHGQPHPGPRHHPRSEGPGHPHRSAPHGHHRRRNR